MSANFQIEIISPDNSLIKTDAEEVVIPSFEGEMGILKGHVPLITFLRPGLIKIKTKTVKEYFVEEGTVEFSKDKLLILSSTIKELKDLDKKKLENLIKLIKQNKTIKPGSYRGRKSSEPEHNRITLMESKNA